MWIRLINDQQLLRLLRVDWICNLAADVQNDHVVVESVLFACLGFRHYHESRVTRRGGLVDILDSNGFLLVVFVCVLVDDVSLETTGLAGPRARHMRLRNSVEGNEVVTPPDIWSQRNAIIQTKHRTSQDFKLNRRLLTGKIAVCRLLNACAELTLIPRREQIFMLLQIRPCVRLDFWVPIHH